MTRWLMLGLVFAAGPAIAQSFALPAEMWAAPRSGEVVRAEPAVRRAVEAWLVQPNRVLGIRHQRRDEALAQAEELRGWLIALGIDAERIVLLDDNRSPILTLEVFERP